MLYSLNHYPTCRFEVRQALIYQLVSGLTDENGKYDYAKAVHHYPPFFDISCSAKNYKIASALTLIDILKDRMLGYEGRSIGVFYDTPSRRFFTSETDLDKQYSWDRSSHSGPLPFPPQQLVDDEDEVFGEQD